MLLLVLLLDIVLLTVGLTEAPDGSVCFDNCNGHGDCIDYSCYCHTGYHGDDCAHTYVAVGDGDPIIPILGAGHFNTSKKDFPSLVLKSTRLLVGFSSYYCHRCIVIEKEYARIAEYLKNVSIPFARANADEMKSIALEHEANEVPSLIYFHKQRPWHYRGSHDAKAVITYIKKQLQAPVTSLKSVEDINSFISYGSNNDSLSLSTVSVIGFFSSHQDVEEDEYDEFMDLARDLQTKEDIFFGAVTSKSVAQIYKKNKTIDRTPSVLLVSEGGIRHTINLDEFIGEQIGLRDWIERKSIPLVGKLTSQNFQLYEKLKLPMLLLFLDLSDEGRVKDPSLVGGKSGGLLNQILVDEYKLIAKEYSDKISFVYLDGVAHQDQMRSLGLYGGAERLPSLAFNTRDGRQIPFPEELPINYDTLNQYCAEFLSGKLRSPKDALELVQKALRRTTPVSQKNKADRKERKKAPEAVTGISEQYGDGRAGDDAIIEITSDNFEEIVLDEEKDVIVVFYSRGCESCAHFAVYYKRMAKRFKELGIESLVVTRMDVTDDSPPPRLNLLVGKLPLFVMIPAHAKHPPWNYYSGISKVQSMMQWVQKEASIPFTLPNLPHLTPEQTGMFKTQIREREEYLDEKRRKEAEEMEQEEKNREEYRLRKLQREQDELEELQRASDQETDAEF